LLYISLDHNIYIEDIEMSIRYYV